MEIINVKKNKKKDNFLKLISLDDINSRLMKNKSESPLAGWGACKLCSCKGFEHPGNSSAICANCNHHYSQHAN